MVNKETNREDAEEAANIARRALKKGEVEKARRMVEKAMKMYPSPEYESLLDEVKAAEPPPPDYTEQQLNAVKEVSHSSDYYETLGVTKESTDTDIKKAYKRLALVLHPDKNRAPGADAAFKKVGSAAAVLLDAEKRKNYDLYRNEDGPRYVNSQARYNARTYEADISAEEFFNMFFNQGFPQMYRATHRQPRQAYQTREAQGNYATFLQMLPILGLILLSTVSTLFISDPVYSLNHSSKFPVMRKTENLKIPYYVKENFHNEYQGSLHRLEMSIEEDYIANLKMACHRERLYNENMAWKARHIDNKRFPMKMPSCEALSNLQRQML